MPELLRIGSSRIFFYASHGSDENPDSIQWWLQQRAKVRQTTFGDDVNEVVKRHKAPKRRSSKAG